MSTPWRRDSSPVSGGRRRAARQRHCRCWRPADAAFRRADAAFERLTPRERDVLRLIASGKSNREMAETLYLSPRTVERHIANIYLKIDVHNKAEATAWALRHGVA